MSVSKRIPAHENLKPEELAKFMRKHGISEHELSTIFGVTINAVKFWLSGEREISVTNTRLVRMFEKYPQLIRQF